MPVVVGVVFLGVHQEQVETVAAELVELQIQMVLMAQQISVAAVVVVRFQVGTAELVEMAVQEL
jgi:Mrp family chromosome partitioning ATPase